MFISSTYTDLRDERQAAVEAILKAGHIPAGMELFAAGSDAQMDIIRRWIDASDIYMLILAGRYGSLEPKTGLSYVELEYDYAVSQSKPVFAVVMTEDALDRRVRDRGREVLELSHPSEYKAFREKVLSRISAFFDDTKDIKLAVHESLADIPARHPLTGWIAGADVPDTAPLFAEIARLDSENRRLREEREQVYSQLKVNNKAETPDRDFEALVKTLTTIEIESTVFDPSKTGKAVRVPLLGVLYSFRDTLITGVTNQHGASDITRVLYFNACPKLQVYGLATNEKVSGVQYRRSSLTQKGLELLAYIDKMKLFEHETRPQEGPVPCSKKPAVKQGRPKPSV